jgi:serine/threonine-protein kinase
LLYYVMPYVEGESLRERIRRERQLPVNDAVGIATAVASALEHAHERGVPTGTSSPRTSCSRTASPW